MIRIAFLDTEHERCVPHVLSDPVLVKRQFSAPADGRTSTEHAISNIERRATREEVDEWKSGK